MNPEKIGALIRQLRHEKHFTQAQLAEKLFVSHKTISKWERGNGLPDVSHLETLAQLLGADLAPLLQGELESKRPDVGNLARTHFYVCPTCGNLITASTSAKVVCCSRTVSEQMVLPATPSHQPEGSLIDNEMFLHFQHPMAKDHYLAFVILLNAQRLLVTRLYPEQAPQLYVPRLKKSDHLLVYCTKDGLQKISLKKLLTP